MHVATQQKKLISGALVGGTVCLLALALHWSGWLTIAELKTLDHRFHRYADSTKAGNDIVLVAVDEASLEAYGSWPWSRDRHGYVVHYLKQAGAKAVVFDILFLEPDSAAEEFDEVFAEEMRAAGNVYLPFLMQDQQEPSADSTVSLAGLQELSPDILKKATIALDDQEPQPTGTLKTYADAKLPTPLFAQAAHGLGYINLTPDIDGTTRRLPLLARARNQTFLHITTAVARDLLTADRATLRRRELQLGPMTIPLTPEHEMVIDWHGTLENRVYHVYPIGAVLRSYTDMQEGKPPLLDPALFRDKIVFVATTAAGTYDLRVTPLSPFAPGVLIHMSALDNILRHRHLQPASWWMFAASTLILTLATAWAFMLIQSQWVKAAAIGGLAIAYYGLAVHAFTSHGLWLDLAVPEGALAVSFAAASTVEYLTEGRHRRQLRTVFDKYMAAEVVDEIMRNPEAIRLGGERKELSVFFSDVAGFTSLSEQLDPETLVELLNKYLSAMTDIILRHRGNVNKYLGDGIMAIFGAPRGDPNHASLACFAALDSQSELARLREQWKAEGQPEISARIGINSGWLVVGNMGSQARMEYTVMGDTVNLASRLEGANKFYDTLILLGPRTYELAAQDIEAREVDLMRVKGKKEPVVVFELLARKGRLSAEQHRVMKTYSEGLEAYKRRDFKTAAAQFEAALALDPGDGPSRVYLERAREYLVAPPPADWDGVYELKSK
ncbi:MAG: adenylate/guanylate cyclase domain-containing protein [Nitrospirota bacterium]|nr:adenylate/guanylate cyclase domain-containing protein [Nitrospirota bacterium]